MKISTITPPHTINKLESECVTRRDLVRGCTLSDVGADSGTHDWPETQQNLSCRMIA
jgi:hypothetical protein